MTADTDVMPSDQVLTAEEIRQRLLVQVDGFCRLTGMSRTNLGRAVTGDKDVIHRISKGGNTTLESYEKIRRYLEENWPHGQTNEVAGV